MILFSPYIHFLTLSNLDQKGRRRNKSSLSRAKDKSKVGNLPQGKNVMTLFSNG